MGKLGRITQVTVKGVLPLLFVVIASISFSSCAKKPTEGTITVVNLADNKPVANASVRMYMNDASGTKGFFLCNEGFVKERTVLTGAGGSITVCFQYPSVISLEVTYTDANSVKKTGVGTLSLVEEETEKVTVKIN